MIELGMLVVGAIIGFIVGGLVYRNNAEAIAQRLAEVEALKDEVTDSYATIEAELKELKSKVKTTTRKKK